MSKGEQPRALRQSLQKSFATRCPPVGGLLDSENCLCPLSQKPVQKWFLPPIKGVAFLMETVFEKNFLVRESISLVAPASAAVTRLAA
jgi:hypothetical protein